MYLEKEDVSIYYEVRGEGEPLLMIHGVVVDAGLYEKGAEILSRRCKVITYDRRGNSRSAFREQKERTFSMDEQAEDVKDLLDALGIEETLIFGASAGAAVGQSFLVKYPERVRHLIIYEPAMLSLIMEGNEALHAWVDELDQLVSKKRYNRALLSFSESIGAPDPDGRTKTQEESLREYNNLEYALTTELAGTLFYKPDVAAMKALRNKISVAAGEHNPETVYHDTSKALAKQLDKELLFYPGGHNFPFERPREFAVCVLGTFGLLDARGDI